MVERNVADSPSLTTDVVHERMKILTAILLACVLTGCVSGTGDYRSKVPIELPPSAEKLLLEHQHATHIVDVQTLLFQRQNYADFLVVGVTINLTRGDFAGWFHQTFVFEKRLDAPDWSQATLHCVNNTDDKPYVSDEELLARPEKELRTYLKLAPIWR